MKIIGLHEDHKDYANKSIRDAEMEAWRMMMGNALATDDAVASWKVNVMRCDAFNRLRCLQLATYPYDESNRVCSERDLYWRRLYNAIIESVTTLCHYR